MDYCTYYAAAPETLQLFGLPLTPACADDGTIDSSVDHQGGPDASPSALPHPALGSAGNMDSGTGVDTTNSLLDPDGINGIGMSPSEEKETLTPAQSRRKAQNRAAQRAFRERKERHVRDLEAKLSALESSATCLATDNERLKQALQHATTENEILRLRATTLSSHRLSIGTTLNNDNGGGGIMALGVAMTSMGPVGPMSNASDTDTVAVAQGLLARDATVNGDGVGNETADGDASAGADPAASPNAAANTNFASLSAAHDFQSPGVCLSSSFLPAAAGWDLIQAHPLVEQGVVDFASVGESLRGTARCNGQGPVFYEDVWRAVESARRRGCDDLMYELI